jgi:glycine oxidase
VSANHGSTDVAIVGAGVIGLAVGWRLASRGLSVTLFERGQPGRGTTHAAAGMIAPIAEARPTEPALLELGQRSASAYPQFLEALAEVSEIDPLYRRVGTVLVARDPDEAAALEWERLAREQLGLPVRRLLASQARELEPALAPSLRLGLEIPDDHAIDPRRLAAALADAVAASGAMLRTGAEVEELIVSGGRVEGVRLRGGERIGAGVVVVAAGPWSAGLAGIPDDARVPLRPVKGQTLCLHDPTGPGLLSRVLRMQPGYLVPRGDGRYVLGATVEERGFDTTVTAGPIHDLLRDVIELVPGVRELVIDELVAGIRPGTPDNAPLIGPGALEGLFWATGHYRHGILLAPVTAEIVVQTLTGAAERVNRSAAGTGLAGPVPAELACAFLPSRFARAEPLAGVR